MDAINPTLALAALLFGLSGNARDAVNDQSAALETEDRSGCPTLILAGDPAQPPSQEMWDDEFWNTASRGSNLPDLTDPSWMESTLLEIKRAQAMNQGSEPIMRGAVTAGKNVSVPTPWIHPCRPKP